VYKDRVKNIVCDGLDLYYWCDTDILFTEQFKIGKVRPLARNVVDTADVADIDAVDAVGDSDAADVVGDSDAADAADMVCDSDKADTVGDSDAADVMDSVDAAEWKIWQRGGLADVVKGA
jgi:hypothetical protein